MKKMFVWQSVGGLTPNYHDGGGCLVIADSLELARMMLVNDGVKESCGAMTTEPDFSASVETSEDVVFVFQDAGCC